VRRAIRKAVPAAEEGLSYQMPVYTLNGVPVLYFDGHDTRESVEALAGRYLEAPARDLGEGSFFWSDLIGLRVEEAGRGEIGELAEIFRAGGNEVYRVVGPAGERLIPALRSVVLEIDLDAGRILVAPEDAETVG
jgi:16S rRNA processing protein RimM